MLLKSINSWVELKVSVSRNYFNAALKCFVLVDRFLILCEGELHICIPV